MTPMEAHIAPLQEQFTSQAQQRHAALFGMWVFLATEVLFFGGLMVTYTAYRVWYPEGFAQGSHHLSVVLGTLNTALLIISSFCMAVAIATARQLERRLTLIFLALTAVLGLCFLGVKGYEWYDAIHQGFWPGNPETMAQPHGFRLFFALYFVMTGLHGIHLIIGISLISAISLNLARQKVFTPNQNRVTALGLYWHFVDIVWIFLYPMLYLIQRYAA
jgi:cytochrome c oxidase subunit 3